MAFSFAPNSFNASLVRLLAPRCFVLLLVVAGMVATEFRFGWIEGAIGSYLITTNRLRPESGTIWEQGHQSDQARRTLAQYTNQRRDAQREARRATTMGQVVTGITDDSGAMISAARFVELYLKLPPVLSHEIVSPYILLARLSNGQWRRTFFERREQELAIYLLDRHSQVLHRLDVGPGLVELIRRGEVAIQTGLHQLGDFAGNIYMAAQFFDVLNSLSPLVRQGIIAHPEELLSISGRIVQVGISSQSAGGAVDLGFEVAEAGGTKVILTQGRAKDVRRLQWALKNRDSSQWWDRGATP